MSRLALIMIDGVSGAYFEEHRANLRNLDALARRGVVVERVAADVPGTSLPGRASIVTGVPASLHGVYGNTIWDGGRFRYANPDDVRVPTLPRVAKDAGLKAAVVGFGMIRPEDATVFAGPWWANEMLQRARDEAPIPADASWLRTNTRLDAGGDWLHLAQAGYEGEVPDAYAGDGMHYLLAAAAGDRTLLRWSAGLLTSAEPPDLLISEILITDSVQHLAGQRHPFSDWAIGYADDLIGSFVAELERGGRLDDTTILVTSDHGHGAVKKALYTDRLLPGREVSSEGSILLVRVHGEDDAQRLTDLLRQHGVERLAAGHLPVDRRADLAMFIAPDGWCFQRRPPGDGAGPAGPARRTVGLAPDAVTGPPTYLSNHGFRPGHPGDERFAIVAGPGIASGVRARAAAEDIAATAASILGLPGVGVGEAFA